MGGIVAVATAVKKWWWMFYLCAATVPNPMCVPLFSEHATEKFETEFEAIEDLKRIRAFYEIEGLIVKDPLWSKE